MTHYFIKNGKTENGPFTKEQLKAKVLSEETPVWFAGLDDWTRAGEVYALREIFLEKKSKPKSLKKIMTQIFGMLLRNSGNKKNYQLLISREAKQQNGQSSL